MTDQPSPESTDGLREIEVEALARFAADLLYNATEFPPTPVGLEAAYLHTFPSIDSYEEMYEYMIELSGEARDAFAGSFKDWIRREMPSIQLARKIEDLKGQLSNLNPEESPEEYNKVFGELVEAESQRRKPERALGGKAV